MRFLPDGMRSHDFGEPFRGYKRTWGYTRPKMRPAARTDEERLVALREWLERQMPHCHTAAELEVVQALIIDDTAAREVL